MNNEQLSERTDEFKQKRIRLQILNVMIAFDFETNADLAKASLLNMTPKDDNYRRYSDLYDYCNRMKGFQRKNLKRWKAKAKQLSTELFTAN